MEIQQQIYRVRYELLTSKTEFRLSQYVEPQMLIHMISLYYLGRGQADDHGNGLDHDVHRDCVNRLHQHCQQHRAKADPEIPCKSGFLLEIQFIDKHRRFSRFDS